MYRLRNTRSHSDISLSWPRHAASAFAASLSVCIVLTATSLHAQIAAESVRPLYEGIGSDYGTPLSDPMGIFFDTVRNECYVADTGNGMVVVFNENGMPVYRFLHDVFDARGRQVHGEPRSLAVDAQGTIYLADARATYLDVLDPRGRSITHIDVPSDHCGQPERFAFVALGPDQTVYAVTACKVPRVALIRDGATVSGTIVLRDPDATRSCVSGFTVDGAGRIYTTDACASRMVQVYAPDGALQLAFGKHDTGYDNFAFPAGIVVTKTGDMWIADSIRQVVSHMTMRANSSP